MGLFNTLRKKFEKESAEEYCLKIDIKLNGNAEKLVKQINKMHETEEKEVKKQMKKRDVKKC